MHTAALHIVVLLNVALLALPPGWCCRSLLAERVVQKPACCRHATPAPADDHQPPNQPHEKCCCSRNATVAEKSLTSIDLPVAVAPLFWASDLLAVPVVSGEASPVALRPGPLRLHVLQCVWRC